MTDDSTMSKNLAFSLGIVLKIIVMGLRFNDPVNTIRNASPKVLKLT